MVVQIIAIKKWVAIQSPRFAIPFEGRLAEPATRDRLEEEDRSAAAEAAVDHGRGQVEDPATRPAVKIVRSTADFGVSGEFRAIGNPP